MEALATTVSREGAFIDPAAGLVAIPLWTAGAPAGLLAAWFPADEIANLGEHRDSLGAVATLAAAALETLRDVERLRAENSLLRERLGVAETGIAGESIAIHKMLGLIARVAPQDTSVLILGETGAGKELVARALHRLSPRAAKPFVAINCAALTETLLESELFGHEKGAFTGAVAQKKGKLEMAEGGTVFLDEIGELAPQLQAKLLRVLQQREFERVGGTRAWKLDVRLVAATNRDLAAEVQRGGFRVDLYHRLNVVTLRVPPCASAPAISPLWPITSSIAPPCAAAAPSRESPPRPNAACSLTPGPAMSANWKTPSSAPWSWAIPSGSSPKTCPKPCWNPEWRRKPREPCKPRWPKPNAS